MKYSTVLLTLVAGVFALPQEASSITSAPAVPSASLTPSQSCVAACDPSDVTCQASCVGVARPNSSQAVETNECAAKCDQGDGSPEATQKFSDCVQSCIASLFPSSQTAALPGAPAASNGASGGASATGSGSPAASTGGSPSGTGSSQQTGTAAASGSAASASSSGAANANSVHVVGAGLAGIMAFFAL